jgi:hypothetical protein
MLDRNVLAAAVRSGMAGASSHWQASRPRLSQWQGSQMQLALKLVLVIRHRSRRSASAG